MKYQFEKGGTEDFEHYLDIQLKQLHRTWLNLRMTCVKSFRQSILTSTYFGAVCIERPHPGFRQAVFISAHLGGTYTMYFQAK